MKVSVPLCAPDEEGLNISCIAALCPAAMVRGNAGEVMLNPVPVMDGWAIVTVVDVPLATLSESDALCPTASVPKLRLEFATVTDPLGVGGGGAGWLPCTA